MTSIRRLVFAATVLFVVLTLTPAPVTAVTLENGEYGVVIAIDPAMPYAGNETMVDDIQDMMRDASSYLHGP